MEKLLKKCLPFIKFAVVGVSGTLVDFGFYTLIRTYIGFPIWIANSISYSLGATNNFFWNKYWTFQDKSTQVKKQFLQFFLVSLGGLVLNTTLIYIFNTYFGVQELLAKLIATFIVLLRNYFINRIWTFKSC